MTELIHAVTTCNAKQFATHGHLMVDSFDQYWPAEVPLTVYCEGFLEDKRSRVWFLNLDEAAPWLGPWKTERTEQQCGMTAKGYRFRADAVRFSHKVAALDAAAAAMVSGLLIWMDADIITHAPVETGWLEKLMPENVDMGWLDRMMTYPESGFMLFRMPGARVLVQRIADLYASGELFQLPEWHDAFAIMKVINKAEVAGEIKVASLSGFGRNHHNVFANSPLAEKMDHLKGARKAMGRTPKHERMIGGGGKYWR